MCIRDSKRGELACTIATLFLAGPFLFAYLMLISHGRAICILLATGFCTIAAYTLMITLARHATGSTLGRRMGVMVGGTWALAYVVFMIVLSAAEHLHVGTQAVLNLAPWGYLISGVLGASIMFKVGTARRS